MDTQEALALASQEAHVKLAFNTGKSYTQGLKVFVVYLETCKILPTDDVTKLTPDHFINFPSWMAMKGYKKKTLLVYLAGVKYFLNWLVIKDFIKPDYNQGLRISKSFQEVNHKRQDHMIRWPGNGDVDKLIAASKVRDYSRSPHPELERSRDIALIRFLSSSGCRNFEVCSLIVGDLDLKQCSAIVRGKGDKDRHIFFDRETADDLRYYFAVRGFSGRSDPVFSRHDRGSEKNGVVKRLGITTNTVRNIIDAACDVAGIEPGKFTPHYFRHAFAIKMLRETGNLALVQDLLGHTDPKATRVYAKIDNSELKEAHHNIYP